MKNKLISKKTYDVVSERSINGSSYKESGKTYEACNRYKKSAIAYIEMSELWDVEGVLVLNFRLKGKWNNIYEFQYRNIKGQLCAIRKTIQLSINN